MIRARSQRRRVPAALLVALTAAAAVAVAGGPAAALPVSGEAEVVAGLRCYPDHEDRALWWYLPARMEMADAAEGPAFRFQRYRYSGTTATGDSGTFWSKGVVTLRVRLEPPAGAVAAARRALERRLGRAVSLQAVPVERVDSVLLYASAGEAGPSGDLDGGKWTGQTGRWAERTFVVGLDRHTAGLLWDTFHAGGLAMSLGYGLVATALPHRPAADPFGGEPEEVEPREVTLVGDALPIRVSPESCSECFASTELDARIPAEYPFLETRCYDFTTGAAPSGLGLVIVEVRATAVTGDPVVERLRFEPGGATSAMVHFRFAVNLDDGYTYRVVRVFGDGRVEAGDWLREETFTGLLDVTRYRPAAGRELDPHALY